VDVSFRLAAPSEAQGRRMLEHCRTISTKGKRFSGETFIGPFQGYVSGIDMDSDGWRRCFVFLEQIYTSIPMRGGASAGSRTVLEPGPVCRDTGKFCNAIRRDSSRKGKHSDHACFQNTPETHAGLNQTNPFGMESLG
jgi:hypothetical protein